MKWIRLFKTAWIYTPAHPKGRMIASVDINPAGIIAYVTELGTTVCYNGQYTLEEHKED